MESPMRHISFEEIEVIFVGCCPKCGAETHEVSIDDKFWMIEGQMRCPDCQWMGVIGSDSP